VRVTERRKWQRCNSVWK